MSNQGVNQAIIFTADTDVLLIATSVFSELSLPELWFEYGKTANIKYIPIYEIVKQLGPGRAGCLSLTGCDQVSFFTSCGKRTAWKTWQNQPQLTESLLKPYNNPTTEVMESEMNTIEIFVCLMHHAVSIKYEVNRDSYTRLIEATCSQSRVSSSVVWARLLIPMQNLPSPDEWGWNKQRNNFVPCQMTQPSISEACKVLTKSGCKTNKGCSGRYSCKKVGLTCTELCKCGGKCD